MYFVDQSRLTQFPYHLQFIGPAGIPVLQFRPLDPSEPLSRLKGWSFARRNARQSWLVLGRGERIRFHGGSPPEPSEVPAGVYYISRGDAARAGEPSVGVPVQSASSVPGFFKSAPTDGLPMDALGRPVYPTRLFQP